jgi:hypothetical protein
MSIFNQPVDLRISGSLALRQELMGKDIRSSQELAFLNSNTSWVSLKSSVNVNESSATAQANVLLGGTLFLNSMRAGVGSTVNNAYSLKNYNNVDNLLGIRPMPGITSVTIDNIGAYGSTRKATVNFQCWDVKQLEILEQLYMRPGYTVLLEFGRNTYLDKDKSNNTILKSITPKSDFFKDKDINLIQYLNSLYELSITNKGNYDAFFGYVVNFAWSSRPDGGYDCKTEILSTGEVVESLKTNYSSAGAFDVSLISQNLDSSFTGFFLNQYKFDIQKTNIAKVNEKYVSNTLAGMLYETHLLCEADTWHNITNNNKQRSIPVKIGDKTLNIDYLFATYQSPQQSKDESTFLTKGKENYYITLESFCDLFTALIIPNTTNGKTKTGKLTAISTKDRGYLKKESKNLLCLFNNYMVSVNPDVCLIDNQRWIDILSQKIVLKGGDSLSTDITNDGDVTTEFKKKISRWVKKLVDGSKNGTLYAKVIKTVVNEINQDQQNSKLSLTDYVKKFNKNYQNIRGTIEVKDTIYKKPTTITNQYGTSTVVYEDIKVHSEVRTWVGYRGALYNGSTTNVNFKKDVTILRNAFENSNTFNQLIQSPEATNTLSLGKALDNIIQTEDNKKLLKVLGDVNLLDDKIENGLKSQADALAGAGKAQQDINKASNSLKTASKDYFEFQKNFNKHFKQESKSSSSFGVIGNIYVNLKFLHKIATDVSLMSQDRNGKNILSVTSFFKAVLKSIQSSLGNINNFELHGDPTDGVIRIIDLNYINEDTNSDLFEFEIGSNKSIVRDLKLEAQLSSEMSSMMAISAQSNAGKTGLDNSTLVSFNQGIVDRNIPAKESHPESLTSVSEQLHNIISGLSVIANKFMVSFFGSYYKGNATFNVTESDSYSDALRDIMSFISSLKNTDNKGKSFLPVRLSMTLDGISGIIIGNLFKLKQEFIPKYYKRNDGKLGYTVIKVDHQLQDNDWTTTIQGYPFNLDSSKIIGDDSTLYNIIVDYNINPSGSATSNGVSKGIGANVSLQKVKLYQHIKNLSARPVTPKIDYDVKSQTIDLNLDGTFENAMIELFSTLADDSNIHKIPIDITEGNATSGHVADSLHYKGKALDIAFRTSHPEVSGNDVEKFLVQKFGGVLLTGHKHWYTINIKGTKIRMFNEYKEPSTAGRGGHFHFQMNTGGIETTSQNKSTPKPTPTPVAQPKPTPTPTPTPSPTPTPTKEPWQSGKLQASGQFISEKNKSKIFKWRIETGSQEGLYDTYYDSSNGEEQEDTYRTSPDLTLVGIKYQIQQKVNYEKASYDANYKG